MSESYELFQRFKPALRASRLETDFVLGTESGFTVYYVPFEYVNPSARLVLVGITPGPDQLKCAHATARRFLTSGSHSDEDILREVKRSCAFDGMRPRINAMLDHFAIPRCIGASTASTLWNADYGRFHTTSVVPNAAFRNGEYFNGPFSDVLKVALLRQQFEDVFIPSIRSINNQAAYIGMGPVVDEALKTCVARRVLRPEQVLGYFPHASGSSGSQFAYFVRQKRLADLKPKDPVRHRVRDLDTAYERLSNNLKAFCANAG